MAERKDEAIYDVYLSSRASEGPLALEVASACAGAGLGVFYSSRPDSHAGREDSVWEALAECRALVLILPPSGPTSPMLVEIGASQAREKPIYVIAADPSTTRLPDFLAGARLYTVGRIDEVVRAVRLEARQWDDDDRSFLAGLYAEDGGPIDALALDPDRLARLAAAFREGRGRVVSEERLLTELYRLKKQGRLAKARRSGRARPRSHPA